MVKHMVWTKELDEQLRELHHAKLRQHEIAAQIGCASHQVQRRVSHLGLPPNTRGRPQAGPLNNNWKGGRSCGRYYVHVICHGHPRANPQGQVPEHILVMEKHLGRALVYDKRPGGIKEVVHHKNGDGFDNRIENLELTVQGSHFMHHNPPEQRDHHGEKHPNAKLTEGMVREFRRLYASGLPIGDIARRYGLPYSTVHTPVKGLGWAHLDQDGLIEALSVCPVGC